MKSKKEFDPYSVPLDSEEQEILDSFERGEWKSVDNLEEELKLAQEIAANTLRAMRKNKRINIRISEYDLALIREKAMKEGLPYQTLIASILHKYARQD